MYVNLKRGTARGRYAPNIPIQEARLEFSKGSPPSKPEGGVLDCGVASEYGGGPP